MCRNTHHSFDHRLLTTLAHLAHVFTSYIKRQDGPFQGRGRENDKYSNVTIFWIFFIRNLSCTAFSEPLDILHSAPVHSLNVWLFYKQLQQNSPFGSVIKTSYDWKHLFFNNKLKVFQFKTKQKWLDICEEWKRGWIVIKSLWINMCSERCNS